MYRRRRNSVAVAQHSGRRMGSDAAPCGAAGGSPWPLTADATEIYSPRMINELDALESKVAEVVSLCRSLRAENAELRLKLSAAEADCALAWQRMETARARIEALAAQLIAPGSSSAADPSIQL